MVGDIPPQVEKVFDIIMKPFYLKRPNKRTYQNSVNAVIKVSGIKELYDGIRSKNHLGTAHSRYSPTSKRKRPNIR